MKTKVKECRWLLAGLLIWLAAVPVAQAFYNPSTGRWLSRDSIDETGGLNLQNFVNNSGLNRVDLLGRCGLAVSPIDETECQGTCASRAKFDTSVPIPVGTKEELLKKCPGGNAACSLPEFSLNSKCEKCKDCRWRVVVDVKVDCKIWYADPDKIPVTYAPSRDAMLNHEKCHCEDWKNELQAMINIYNSASYADSELCEKARGHLDQTFLDRWAQRMTASRNHSLSKYRPPSGPCYATGEFK